MSVAAQLGAFVAISKARNTLPPPLLGQEVSSGNPFRVEFARLNELCQITWGAKSAEEQIAFWRSCYRKIKLPKSSAIGAGQIIVPSMAFWGTLYSCDPHTQEGHKEVCEQVIRGLEIQKPDSFKLPKLPAKTKCFDAQQALQANNDRDYVILRPMLGTDTWCWSPRAVHWEALQRNESITMLSLPHILAALAVVKLEQCEGCETHGIYLDACFYCGADKRKADLIPSVQLQDGKRYLKCGMSDQTLPCGGSALAVIGN